MGILAILPTWGAIAILFSCLGIAKQKYRQIIQQRFNWGLGILSIWLVITCCFAHNRVDAFLGLPNLLPYFGIFACLSIFLTTTAQLRRLAWLIVILSLSVIILGLGQMLWGWTTPPQLQPLLGWELVAYGNPEGRMSSVFIYTNLLAAYLLVVFTLGLGLWIDTYQTWHQNPHQKLVWKLGLLSLIIAGSLLCLVLTSSRNAWGISILVFITFAVYLGWRWLVWAMSTAIISVLWASFGSLPGQTWLRKIVPIYIWGRLSDQFYPVRDVGTLRSTQWQFTLQMTQERPWLGWGLRNFTAIYEQQVNEWLGHPHNLYLMLMAETGIPAIIFLSSLLGWMMMQAVLLLSKWSQVIGNNRDKII